MCESCNYVMPSHSSSGTSDSQVQTVPARPGVCPHCGYCPTCGRKDFYYPYPNYPYYPGPYWQWYTTNTTY